MTMGVHSIMASGVYINISDTSLESFEWMEGIGKDDVDFVNTEVSGKLSGNPNLAAWQMAFKAARGHYLPSE